MYPSGLSPLAVALASGTLAALIACLYVSLEAHSRRRQLASARIRSYLSHSSGFVVPIGASSDSRGSRFLAEAGIRAAPRRLLAWLALGGFGSGALVLSMTGMPLAGLAAAIAAPTGVFWLYASRGRSLSRKRLVDQVPVMLEALSNAMRAGSTLPQAILQASEDMKPPISPILRGASAAYRIGRPLDQVLVEMQQRVNMPVMQFVIASILVNRDAGGSLAPLLLDAAELVRDDLRLQRELDVATAQVRLSARLVGLLPVALLGGLAVMNPASLTPFFSSPAGVLMLLGAGMLDAVGFVLVLRASRVDL
jgi:tight adherence protein B